MKFAVFLLFTAFVSVYCGEESDSSEEVRQVVKEVSGFLKTKLNVTIIDDVVRLINKTTERCPDIEDKIEKAIDEVDTCLDAIELGSDTLCALINKNFLHCVEPARKVVANCLPDESKDLPGLFNKILLAIINQGCSSTVEQILELFNPCQTKEEFVTYEPCNKIKDVLVESKNKLPSKELVCKTLPKVRQCVKSHIDASCKNPITKQSIILFHDAADKAIAEDCQGINVTN